MPARSRPRLPLRFTRTSACKHHRSNTHRSVPSLPLPPLRPPGPRCRGSIPGCYRKKAGRLPPTPELTHNYRRLVRRAHPRAPPASRPQFRLPALPSPRCLAPLHPLPLVWVEPKETVTTAGTAHATTTSPMCAALQVGECFGTPYDHAAPLDPLQLLVVDRLYDSGRWGWGRQGCSGDDCRLSTAL